MNLLRYGHIVVVLLGITAFSVYSYTQFSAVEDALNAPAIVAEIVELEADELLIPDESRGGWNVGVEPDAIESRPVNLSGVLPARFRIWGGVVAAKSGIAILTYMDQTDRDEKTTVGLICDVKTGRGLARWQLEEFLAPYAIHPDGHTSIFTRKDGIRYQRETLFIGRKVEGTNVPELQRWQPLVDPDDKRQEYNPEFEIMWAAFAGSNRIVTLNNNGKLHIWNLKTLSRLGVVTGVKGIPSLTPDGNKVAFLTDKRVSLLDPGNPEIVCTTLVGDLPEEPVLAFHPDGRILAIAGKGRTLMFDTTNHSVRDAMIESLNTSRGMELLPDVAWFGNYIYGNEKLYVADSPIPVWSFESSRWLRPINRSLWGVVRAGDSRDKFVLRSFDVPVAKIERELEEIYRNEDVIALESGDPVAIDVSGLPADRQDQTYSVLAKRLRENGFLPSQNADVTLRAFLEESRDTEVTYQQMWSGREKFVFEYTIQAARMEFVRNDDCLWYARRHVLPPGSLSEESLPRSTRVEHWGGPDYDLFEQRQLPAFLCGTRGHRPLGRSRLLAEGLD